MGPVRDIIAMFPIGVSGVGGKKRRSKKEEEKGCTVVALRPIDFYAINASRAGPPNSYA